MSKVPDVTAREFLALVKERGCWPGQEEDLVAMLECAMNALDDIWLWRSENKEWHCVRHALSRLDAMAKAAQP